MSGLSQKDKELIIDVCLGIADSGQIDHVMQLTRNSEEAAQLMAAFQHTLSPLDQVIQEPCPDELAIKTVMALKSAANSSKEKLEQLIGEHDQNVHVVPMSSWRQVAQIAAVAAIVVFVVSIVFTSAGSIRQIYYRQECGQQLASIYQGLSQYMNDHQGTLPAVAASQGAPWWKVGYQGQENNSNTRALWLLAKQGYLKPEFFICPGRQPVRHDRYEHIDVASLYDFPSQQHINYSFRINCPQNQPNETSKGVLMADRNPLAERLPDDFNGSCQVVLDKTLLESNSQNHKGSGQNVMTYDGAVLYTRTRFLPNINDDIYSLQNMRIGSRLTGCETPSNNTDAFLAP